MAKKKKKDKGIEFSMYERRVFELPFGPLKGREHTVLRKMIDAMPWLCVVAECKFDPHVAAAAKFFAAAQSNLQLAILNYHKRTGVKNGSNAQTK